MSDGRPRFSGEDLPFTPGDANCDGVLTLADVQTTLTLTVGLWRSTQVELRTADADFSGTVEKRNLLLLLCREASGLDESGNRMLR
ncbi:MAG: hypothetical protein ACUVTZ_06195 [Armatimonadota bacterium]